MPDAVKQTGKPPWSYRLLVVLLLPAVLAHVIWRAFKDGGTVYLQQRLGIYSDSRKTTAATPETDNRLWVHAASVGEVNTVSPLLHALLERHQDLQLLVTTNTPTGKAAFERLELPRSQHVYLPVDYANPVRRFYSTQALQVGLIVETEIWPHLYHAANIPLMIINGRLSERTTNAANALTGAIYRASLNQLQQVLARSEQDVQAFTTLGLDADKVRCVGNLKAAHAMTSTAATKTSAPLIRHRYGLLASTHDDEELKLAGQWIQRLPEELLVIAPRHVERKASLIRQLRTLTDQLAIRSEGQLPDASTQIYLADTYGELMQWYQHADAIFLGGSLTDKGGHNLIEPARVGKAVVTGPNTDNFKEEMDRFVRSDAVVIARNEHEIVDVMLRWFKDPDSYRDTGRQAATVANSRTDGQAGILTAYLDGVTPFIPHT